MITKQLWIRSGLLLAAVILIRFFCLNAFWVEKWYSTGVYPYIASFLRSLFGWLPFSIGDVFYGIVLIWLLLKFVKGLKLLIIKKFRGIDYKTGFLVLFNRLCIVYIIFNVLWGINYNRKGIAWQLDLPKEKYSVAQLIQMNELLLQKVNESKKLLINKPQNQLSDKEIFSLATNAYKEVVRSYSFLSYKPTAVKSSLWGWFGNYLSFSGYYNPFSGEAQVNTGVPVFLQPYTTCHEIAHQLGYAKENEANFVGYLAATSSKEPLLLYSVYLDMFQYTNRNLYTLDSALARTYSKQLIPEVKADVKEWRQFVFKHRNAFEPVVRWMYGKYLESNQQPTGMLSYDAVTGFLIAYYNKFGKI